MLSLWYSDKIAWNNKFQTIENEFVNDLYYGFQKVDNHTTTLELVHDNICQKLYPSTMHFGHYTSIESVLEAVLSTTQPIQSILQSCTNNHIRHIANLPSLHVSVGATHYQSTSIWSLTVQESIAGQCQTCSQNRCTEYQFLQVPPLLVFEFSNTQPYIDNNIQINCNNQVYEFALRGIIYFGEAHFNVRIIPPDGQI